MRETGDGGCELRISSAQRTDAGVYVCRVINDYGSKQVECRVEVRGEEVKISFLLTGNSKLNIFYIIFLFLCI